MKSKLEIKDTMKNAKRHSGVINIQPINKSQEVTF